MKTKPALCLLIPFILALVSITAFKRTSTRKTTRPMIAIGNTPPQTITSQSSTDSDSNANLKSDANKARVLAAMSAMLLTPITFYGKVMDQHGQPVPHTDVGYSLHDRFLASGSIGKATADENGAIRISGVRGAMITVGVTKPGYYGVDGKSALSFAYGTPPDDYRLPPPTAESPAIFLLHKRGVASPLLHVKKRNHNVPRDGTPVRIELATGQVSPTGELKVEAWTQEREPNGPRFYAWRCRVSIPGGGLLERTDELDFLAPADGYKDFVEVAYTNDRENWWPRFESEYFVRTKDNRHARVGFYFTSGGSHFSWLETYLNPVPGDRNLEFDENNQWQP